MNNRLFLLLIVLLGCQVSMEAHWQCPVTNYTRRMYGAGNQNWSIEQHDNGWIYIANNKGLLEFDGVHWNTYPIRNAKTRSVLKGADGRIYIGGMGQFGFFTPDKLGGLRYTCLSDSLPVNTTSGVVWNVRQNDRSVFFQADRSLFAWDNVELRRIDTEKLIYTTQMVGDNLYVATSEGLMLLNGKELHGLCSLSGIGSVVRMGGLQEYNGKLLVVSRDNGIYMYDGHTVQRYATSADEFCRSSRIFCAALKDSLLALGSVQDGVCLLNLNSGEMEKISIENGLQNKTVLNMYFDDSGDLWLGLDNGIDRIHLNARVANLYGGRSIIGSGYASCCYEGNYYLGTNQGLYRTQPPARFNKNEIVEFIPGTGGQVWSLRQYDGKLFCCADNGIFVVDGKQTTLLKDSPKGVWDVVALHGRNDVLIAGTYNGMYLLKKVGNEWRRIQHIDGVNRSCKEMMVEEGTNAVWIGNKENGASRVILSEDLTKVTKIRNYVDDGFPNNYDVYFAQSEGKLVVTSREGLWRYNRSIDRLERDTFLEELLDGRVHYSYLSLDSQQNIYYVTDGTLKRVRYDAVAKTYDRSSKESLLSGSLIENFEDLHFCEQGQLIVGTEEGYALLVPDHSPASTLPRSIQIRKVYLTGLTDSLIYGRSYTYDESLLQIPYHNNSLRIEYCTNQGGRQPFYSYRLSNGSHEGEWSEYSKNHTKEFTGLNEGHYTFSVKLMPLGKEEPVITSFSFEILPPWYRTWWSYLIYTLFAALACLLLYHRTVTSRKRLLMQKELELLRQKQTFEKESELKDQKIDSLKEENLQSELRYKSEELVRTTLNIVRKNEMLQDIKKEVVAISHSITEENLVALRRKILRLIGQIDTNIEHDDDLQAFQSSFDSVHHNFFHRLEEAYPELSHKDKMLCAYIKMNLLSKEIAPLMNISLRGVEISRYRLRKKLGLEEGGNLSEFLQKFGK